MATSGYRPQPVPQGDAQRYGYDRRDGTRDRRYDAMNQEPYGPGAQPRRPPVNNQYPSNGSENRGYDNRPSKGQSNGRAYNQSFQDPYQQPYVGPARGRPQEEFQDQFQRPYQVDDNGYANAYPPAPQNQERSYQYDPRYRNNGQDPPEPRARSRPPPEAGRSRPPPLNMQGQGYQNGPVSGYEQRQQRPGDEIREVRPRTRDREPDRILKSPRSPKTIAWDNPFPTFPNKKDPKSSKHSSLDKEHSHQMVDDARRAKADPERPSTAQGSARHELTTSHASNSYPEQTYHQDIAQASTNEGPESMDKLIKKVIPSYKTGPPLVYENGMARLAAEGATYSSPYPRPASPQQQAFSYDEFVPGPYGGTTQQNGGYNSGGVPLTQPERRDREDEGMRSRVPEPAPRVLYRDRVLQKPPPLKQPAKETFDESSYRGVPRNNAVSQRQPPSGYPEDNAYRGVPQATPAQQQKPPTEMFREASDGLRRINPSPERPQVNTHAVGPSMPNFDLINMSPHERTEDHLPIPGAFEQSAYDKPTYKAYSPVEDLSNQQLQSQQGEIIRSPRADFSFDIPPNTGHTGRSRGGRGSYDDRSYDQGYDQSYTNGPVRQPRRGEYSYDQNYDQPNMSGPIRPPRQDSYGAPPARPPHQNPNLPQGVNRAVMQPRSASDGYGPPQRGEFQDYPQEPSIVPQGQRPHTSHGQRAAQGPSRDYRRQHTGQGTGPEFAMPPSRPPQMLPLLPQSRMGGGDLPRYNSSGTPVRPISHDDQYGSNRPLGEQNYGYDDRSYSMPNPPQRQRTFDQELTKTRTYDQPYPQPPVQQRMPPNNPMAGLPERPKTANSSARPPPVRHYGDNASTEHVGNGQINNPDALPPHPVPIRPGLMQNSSQPQSQPQPQRAPQQVSQQSSQQGQKPASQSAASPPVTVTELNNLREYSKKHANDHAIALQFAKKLVEASVVLADEGGTAEPKQTAKNREKYILEAHKVIKKLANANYPEAVFYLGECHGTGQLGLAQDPGEAFKYYHSAAKSGHPEAAFRTGVCCEIGVEGNGGTKRDPFRAVQWFEKAASLGNNSALYKMGMVTLKGELGQPVDRRKAIPYLKRAAELADVENPHALHQLAAIYESPEPNDSILRDDRYALQLYQKAADLGYKHSQHRLGCVYEYALLGEPRDARRSIYWYTHAAKQGQNEAMLALCGWYLTGAEPYLQQSDADCYGWAMKAASTGLAKAMHAVGHLTETGIGVAPNLEEAKAWYYRAAAKNWEPARKRLEEIKQGAPRAQKTTVSRSGKQKEGDCVVM